MADRRRHDPTYAQRWAMRAPASRGTRRVAVPSHRHGADVASRNAVRAVERPLFQPHLRAVTPNVSNLWEHRGTDSDRAFGRTVHEVLHRGLLELQTDPLSQDLIGRLRTMRAGAARTEVERRLIEHEMRRAGRLLSTVWESEKGSFPVEAETWRRRAADYIGRYVASDEYLLAAVWRYPIRDAKGQTTLVPMLEFPFRVRTRSGVVLVGRFDRVDDRGGRPVVIDYKTGPPRSMTALRHDHQLLLYAAAIADLTGARSVTCEIHWLSTGTRSSLVFSGAELRRAREEAAKYVRQAERHALFGTPGPEAHVPEPMPRSARPPAAEGPAAA